MLIIFSQEKKKRKEKENAYMNQLRNELMMDNMNENNYAPARNFSVTGWGIRRFLAFSLSEVTKKDTISKAKVIRNKRKMSN